MELLLEININLIGGENMKKTAVLLYEGCCLFEVTVAL